MPSMSEMVEAHLMNVQREISNLNERKVAIDKEIEKLQQYLQDGQKTLLDFKKAASVQQQSTVSSSVFN